MTDFPIPPKAADTFEAYAQEHGYSTRRNDSHGSVGLVQDVFWHRVTAWKGDVLVEAEWQINAAPVSKRFTDIPRSLTEGRWRQGHHPIAWAKGPAYDQERWDKGYAPRYGKDTPDSKVVLLTTLADAKRLMLDPDAVAWIRNENNEN